MKLGVRLESLGLPLRRSLDEVQRLAVSGVQVDAVGDLSPTALSQTGRREFRHLLRARELELTALGCPLRHGLHVVENQEARLEHVQRVLTLSFDLGARLVILSPGPLPREGQETQLNEALLTLSQFGDRIGAVLALETGLESGETLNQYLARFDTGSLGANLDPANLLLHGFDPYASAEALRGRIRHVHAKDARLANPSRSAEEVPLGHGDIDWMRFLGVLEQVEYRGWLTIERESGEQRLADVRNGVAFLRRLLPPSS